MPLIGFRKHVMETRQPLVIDEPDPEVFERYGNPRVLSGETTQCGLFVPLIVGGRATGVISLQNIDRTHAFGESDQQLLTTLAGSLSVALENARLVHETRQRNAELALINGVQEAIAGELEPQAIYDAVGDRIRDVFDAQVVQMSTLDDATGLVHYPYIFEQGERLQAEPLAPVGFAKHVLETRETLSDARGHARGGRALREASSWSARPPKSLLFVPLVTGGKATGAISLQNIDREHAFSESDQQLLETLAGSLSVALENARLVHETRQRNAELALINGVQDAIAGELEPQAIYDASGTGSGTSSTRRSLTIGTLDEATGLMEFPYIIERGERLEAEPATGGSASRKHVLETRRAAADRREHGGRSRALRQPDPGRRVAQVGALRPARRRRKATGVISLQNVDREHAFGESDQQLLTTLAGSLSVALENARLVHETRQRVGELATVNSVGQALSSQLDLDALIELVGEQVRETFDADIAYVALHDEAAATIEFAYYYESGERRSEASDGRTAKG